MKPIEIHIEGYKIVISKEDEQPDILKDKRDEKITIPSYPNYPVIPTNPIMYPYVTWTYGEMPVTNTETKCETPVRDMMVGKVSDE